MRTRKRRFRAFRNLLIAVLFLAAAWWSMGSPMPTRTMELHRSEEVYLIDRSTIVFSCESEGERMLGDPVMLVALSKRTIQTYSDTHPFNVWPRNPEGATLVALPSELEYEPALVAGLVAVDPPALAETAQLTIDVTGGEGPARTVSGEKSGAVFLFRLEETEDQPLDRLFHTTELPPYTLTFFAPDGTMLETTADTEN